MCWMKGITYDYCRASVHSVAQQCPEPGIYPSGRFSSVVITRMAGRTPVPEREEIATFAAHHCTMVVLSTGLLNSCRAFNCGRLHRRYPAAIVYKATWEDEKAFICTVGTLAQTAKENNITKTALMIIGDVVTHSHYNRSELYNPAFTTEFREASK